MITEKLIVLGVDGYNTCGIIRTLGEANLDFTAILIRDQNGVELSAKSKYLKTRTMISVGTMEEAFEALLRIKENLQEKAYLIVEGDGNTEFLDGKYDDLIDSYIWNNAGGQGKLSKYLDKYEQIELARECGIKVIDSIVVKNGEVPDNIEYPIITKAVSSALNNWKSESFICEDEEELVKAFDSIKSSEVLVQKYIHKKNEYVYDGFSIDRGKKQFIAICSTYNYLIPGEFAFYATARDFDDEKVEREITEFMSRVGYEGIYEFEYIVDENGEKYFMENNFRNSGWSYAATCAGMPLPILWVESMKSGFIDESKRTRIGDGLTFVLDYRDFKARVKEGNYSIFRWLKEYKDCDCRLMMGRGDSGAFVSFLFGLLRLKVKKVLRLGKRRNRN